jgi:serine/threonine-protein phosphatase 2B regulatory subunit
MGQGHSFTGEELSELQKGNSLTQAQILKLHKRFRKLDKDGNGEISKEEFMAIPSLSSNPLLSRALEIFDTDGNNSVDFREFVKALAIFSPDVSPREKVHFMFKIYDCDMDGKLSNRDLYRVLQIMVGTNLSDTQLQQIVDKTFIEANTSRSGFISFEEFERIITNSDYGEKLTMSF